MSTAIKEPRLWDYVTRAGGSSIVLSVPGLLPAEAAERRHGRVLPDAVGRVEVHVPGRAEGRDRGGRRRVPLRHEGLPHRRQGVPPASGLRDDRPALRARGAPRSRRSRGRCSRWSRWGRTGCTTGSGSTWIPSTASTSPGNAYETAILDYHRHVDGAASGSCSSTRTRTRSSSSLSDHGAKRLDGGIRINEWLRREGLLTTLRRARGRVLACETSASTGRRRRRGARAATTRASSSTSQGREPEGRSCRRTSTRPYATTSRAGSRRSRTTRATRSRPRSTSPRSCTASRSGVAPDLIVVFGDLLWRSVGTIGGDEGVQTLENDTGPDDANHAQDGLYVVAGPGDRGDRARDAHLLDIAPTILEILEIEEPEGCAAAVCSRSWRLAERHVTARRRAARSPSWRRAAVMGTRYSGADSSARAPPRRRS